MVTALALSILLGIGLGVLAARRRAHRRPTRSISIFALLSYATPTVLDRPDVHPAVRRTLGWLPTSGMEPIGAGSPAARRAVDVARHLRPARGDAALFYMAIYTRLMRASMLEVYGLDYVRTAQAKGLTERQDRLQARAAQRAAAGGHHAGLQVGSLLGGSVLVETVFGWPGLGRLAFDAVFQRDFNLLLGILLLCSVLVVLVNLVVDLLYAVLDPRIEMQLSRLDGLLARITAATSPPSIGLVILLVVVGMARLRAAALSRRSVGHGRRAVPSGRAELRSFRSAPTCWAAMCAPASSMARACRS